MIFQVNEVRRLCTAGRSLRISQGEWWVDKAKDLVTGDFRFQVCVVRFLQQWHFG